jgi:hypothetical protein
MGSPSYSQHSRGHKKQMSTVKKFEVFSNQNVWPQKTSRLSEIRIRSCCKNFSCIQHSNVFLRNNNINNKQQHQKTHHGSSKWYYMCYLRLKTFYAYCSEDCFVVVLVVATAISSFQWVVSFYLFSH